MKPYEEQCVQDVSNRLRQGEHLEILDVREPEEWLSGHIPAAKHIPLPQLPERIREIDRNKEWLIVCRSGNRSARACEFLSAQGYRVTNLAGGMLEWDGDIQTGR